MQKKKYDVELHRKAFLLWANGIGFRTIAHLEGFPAKSTIIAWSKSDYPCDCGYHGWKELRHAKEEEIKEFAETELPSLVQQAVAEVAQETKEYSEAENALKEFIAAHEKELRPVFKRIRKAFGIKTDGSLTGDMTVDMIITGYIAVLKARYAIARIKINDAYQLIQLMRTIITIFKEWQIPVEEEEGPEEETIEIKLKVAEKPTGAMIDEEKEEDEQEQEEANTPISSN